MKYVPHKVIYTLLPKAVRSLPSSELDNYIIQAIRQINAIPMYERKLAYTIVKDGKANLPDDFFKMSSVSYLHKEPTTENLKEFGSCFLDDIEWGCDDTAYDADTIVSESCMDPANAELLENTDLNSRHSLFTIRRSIGQGLTEDVYVARRFAIGTYLTTNYYTDCWVPLRVSKNVLPTCMESDSCNYISNCDYTYNITSCGQLITTLPDGIIQYIYTGRIVDCDGNFMIPDNQEFFNVIKDGVMMYFFEDERASHTQGSINNHREYRQEFFKGVAGLRGKYMLPNGSTQDKRLRTIIYHKMRIANDYSETGNSFYSGDTYLNHMTPWKY